MAFCVVDFSKGKIVGTLENKPEKLSALKREPRTSTLKSYWGEATGV